MERSCIQRSVSLLLRVIFLFLLFVCFCFQDFAGFYKIPHSFIPEQTSIQFGNNIYGCINSLEKTDDKNMSYFGMVLAFEGTDIFVI